MKFLVGTGNWDEVCMLYNGVPPILCGGGTDGDGPFRLYSTDGADRVPLFRCSTGADHFLTNDPNCEGFTNEAHLGWAATAPSSAMPRTLTRCYSGTAHFWWIDAPCPPGTGEAFLGYVR